MEDTEPVFKALADPNRRLLLDKLHEQDGQTLLELQRHLPEMTRFGTMKHLKVLEEAGLVITRRSGREKHHFLNRVPIQMVYDRWVSKFARPWARSLTGLKYLLEESPMSETISHYFEVYIRSTPEKVWQALTDGAMTANYYYGTAVESDWKNGSTYQYSMPDGNAMISGEVVESDPPRKLVTTFQPHWDEESEKSGLSKVTYELTPVGDAVRLTLLHEGIDPALKMAQGVVHGWSAILSGLKTYIETGEALNLPPM